MTEPRIIYLSAPRATKIDGYKFGSIPTVIDKTIFFEELRPLDLAVFEVIKHDRQR